MYYLLRNKNINYINLLNINSKYYHIKIFMLNFIHMSGLIFINNIN